MIWDIVCYMARIKKTSNEDAELITVFDWIRLHKDIEPFAWHVGNERKCTAAQGLKLKRKGVKAGVSDICLMIPSKGYHGAFIELKYGDGKPTKSQEKFLANMDKQNYFTAVCWGADEAIEMIEWYLKP